MADPVTVHVIGAGLAGLSAAVELAACGRPVVIHEAGPRAGGRCRSYHDPQLGMEIDNGNHLVLSGNRAVHAYLARIGAGDRLHGPAEASFAFADLATGERWTVRPNAGPLPWWILDRQRKVPGTRMLDYLRLTSLLRPRPGIAVGETVATAGPLWERLIEPVLLAALNTPAAEGSARLASAVIRETMGRGGHAYRPLVAQPTLAAAFVDPALAWLAGQGAKVRFGRRLRAIAGETRVTSLDFGDDVEALGPDGSVVLAVPAPVAAALLPGLTVPTAFNAIVSAHFAGAAPPGTPPILGLVNASTEWIFALPGRISVTISAADAIADEDREALAARLWSEVAAVLGLTGNLPRWQVVKEKRATFAATAEQDALRPGAATRWANLALAGDWTQTGLPATIEGAIRSGVVAAGLAG